MRPSLEHVPREFADNRFLGLRAALEVFQEAFDGGEEAVFSELVRELSEGGYPPWPDKEDLLVELNDIALFRRSGIDGLLDHYEGLRLRAEPTGDPVAHRGLGLLFQSEGHLDAAEGHYERSLHLWGAAGDPRAQKVADLLITLEHQRREHERHPFFTRCWSPIEEGRVDARQMLRDAVTAALIGSDWRLGREAVAALERLRDWQTLEQLLASSPPRVQVAALAVLRRHGARQHESALRTAFTVESPVVRWQAALALQAASLGAADPLIEGLRQDPAPCVRAAAAESLGKLARTGSHRSRADAELQESLKDADPNVQVAAASGLGKVGDRKALRVLRSPLPDVSDFRGRSLRETARQSADEIESRSPAPARPSAPPRPSPGPSPAAPSPVVHPRTPADSQRYLRSALALQILHAGLGAALIGMVDLGMAAGYLLYAALAKWLIEPFVAPFDFFAGKPCHPGRPAQRPRSGWLRSRLRAPLVCLPLSLFPFVAWVLLVAREASLFSAIAIVPLLLHAVLRGVRIVYLRTAACPSCPARPSCPVWNRFLPS